MRASSKAIRRSRSPNAMKPRPTCWRRCIARPLPDILPLTPQPTYAIPIFDIEAWQVEMGLMLEWYLPDRGIEAEP